MGLFSELMEGTQEQEDTSIHSIMTGIVKEIWNTKYPGMVNVEYILTDKKQKVTDWIRVATPYGGNSYGMYTYPEVGTEVVIAFVMGNIDSPVIIGSLWNQTDALPTEVPGEKNLKKAFLTKGGNQIMISDEEGKETIEIKTKGNLSVHLEDEKKNIEIADADKNNVISIDGDKGVISITAKSKITLTAGAETITLDGESKKSQVASNQFQVEGKQAIELKSNSSLKAEGAMIEVKAKSNLKAEASGMLTLKGSMTKIN